MKNKKILNGDYMKRKEMLTVFFGIIAVAIMSYVETVIKPGYLLKSVTKVIVFAGSIIVYCLINKSNPVKLLNIKKPVRAKSLFLFVGLAYCTIIGAFFVLKNFIDLSTIKDNLVAKEGLTKDNCLYIFIYIILINSFLEESFFRGFMFRGLKNNRLLAYLISSLFFALYHIGIVDGWFNPFLFVLCIVGLMIAGMMLDYVCEKYDSLLTSWLVHATANLAINTIGIYLIFFM